MPSLGAALVAHVFEIFEPTEISVPRYFYLRKIKTGIEISAKSCGRDLACSPKINIWRYNFFFVFGKRGLSERISIFIIHT